MKNFILCAVDVFIQYIRTDFVFQQPGRANPVVDLWVVDLNKLLGGNGDTVTRLAPPTTLATVDHYFTTVAWATHDSVAIIWMNRHQVGEITLNCS